MKHPLKSHLLVFFQMAGLALACYPVGLINRGSAWVLIVCLAGAALGVMTLCYNKISNFSVYPEIRDSAKLITSGPYAYVRHPMYVALIIMMWGVAFYNGYWTNFVGALLVTAVVITKSRIEEGYLQTHFSDYPNYKNRTAGFVPGLF